MDRTLRYLEFNSSSQGRIIRSLVSINDATSNLITGHELFDDSGLDSKWRSHVINDFKFDYLYRQIHIIRSIQENITSNVLTLSGALVSTSASLEAATNSIALGLSYIREDREAIHSLRDEVVNDERLNRMVEIAQLAKNGADAVGTDVSAIPVIGPLVKAVEENGSAIGFAAVLTKALISQQTAAAVPTWNKSMDNQYTQMLLEANRAANIGSEVINAAHYARSIIYRQAAQFAMMDRIHVIASGGNIAVDMTPQVCIWMEKRVSRTIVENHDYELLEEGDILFRYSWPVTVGSISMGVHSYVKAVLLVSLSRGDDGFLDVKTRFLLYNVGYDESLQRSIITRLYSEGDVDVSIPRSHLIGDYTCNTNHLVALSFWNIISRKRIQNHLLLKMYNVGVKFSCSRSHVNITQDVPYWQSLDTIALLQSYHSDKTCGNYTLNGAFFVTHSDLSDIVTAGGHDASGYNAGFQALLDNYIDVRSSINNQIALHSRNDEYERIPTKKTYSNSQDVDVHDVSTF
jgi:hypothetical protein